MTVRTKMIIFFVVFLVLPLAWHFYNCIKCLREPWPFDEEGNVILPEERKKDE